VSNLTIVIPAYNESESLSTLLPELLVLCSENSWNIIVVDDGSTDSTQELLGRFIQQSDLLLVLRHKLNRGYGGALKSGIQQAKTEFVVTFDADGQHKVEDIGNMLAFIQQTGADMVVGARQAESTRSVYRRAGKQIIRFITSILVPNNIKDLNSGFKMYHTSLVHRYLQLCPDSMAFSDVITLVFIRRKHLVLNFPIQVGERAQGKSTINTYTAIDTLYELLNIIMLFNPMRIFLSVSVMCLAFGVLWGIPILMRGRGVSVGAMLAIVTGLIFFFLGLVAEQLAQIRLNSIGPAPDSDAAAPSSTKHE
jgi:glycosyltransferase involved in cell wall biosynthesis